jgi:ElaB/YqjD/DUF883 family membrane-anchored ribosome-binding protein
MEHERTMGTTGTWSGQSSQPTGERAGTSNLRSAAKSAREGMEQAGEYINETMAKTQEAVNRYREGGVEQVKQDVVGYTREQPMTALIVASAVGVVLGMLMAMGRSR